MSERRAGVCVERPVGCHVLGHTTGITAMATQLHDPMTPGPTNLAAGVDDRIKVLCLGAAALAGLGMTYRALEACEAIVTLRGKAAGARRVDHEPRQREQRPLDA